MHFDSKSYKEIEVCDRLQLCHCYHKNPFEPNWNQFVWHFLSILGLKLPISNSKFCEKKYCGFAFRCTCKSGTFEM